MVDSSDADRLAKMITGYRRSQLVYLAAKLEVVDAVGDGTGLDELARALSLAPGPARKLVRSLAAIDVLAVAVDGTVAVGRLGRLLHRDGEGSLWSRAIVNGEEQYEVWRGALRALADDTIAYEDLFGRSLWDRMASDEAATAAFYDASAGAVAERYGGVTTLCAFGDDEVIVDVGCGSGELIAHLLDSVPGSRAVVLDLPMAVERAEARLRSRRLDDRCTFVRGSAMDAVPAGGTTYLLSRMLQDFDDQGVVTVLGRCAAAMGPSSRVLVLGRVLDEERFGSADVLTMHLFLMTGGGERTAAEYHGLFASAGLDLVDVHRDDAGLVVLEGRRAELHPRDEVGSSGPGSRLGPLDDPAAEQLLDHLGPT